MTAQLQIPKKQVLIVDDASSNIDTLSMLLGEEYDLCVALDGVTALQSIGNGLHPDLILLDIMMPEMSGYEVCHRLKSAPETSDISIIFLTALCDSHDQEKGLKLGAVDYITKPFEPALVKLRIRNHLALKEYRDNLEEKVKLRTQELENAQGAIVANMGMLAEFRDPETGGHIQRTKYYIRALANEAVRQFPQIIPAQLPETLFVAAPLHDIGKVGIADAILQKPGRLNAEEFAIMEQHTTIGAKVLRQTEAIYGHNEMLHTAAQIAEFHHEKWDGSGYPHGISGEKIPLAARLMTIADVYDALTSIRPYKKAFSHATAMAIILESDGYTKPEDFDPRLLQCFAKINQQFATIAAEFRDLK